MTSIINACVSPGQIHRLNLPRQFIPSNHSDSLRHMVSSIQSFRNHYPTAQMVGPSFAPLTGRTERDKDFSLDPISVSGGQHPPTGNLTYTPPLGVGSSSIADTIETAIEFVLALEHPCMAHIPYPADQGGHDPANHIMMVCFFFVLMHS